MPRILPLEKKGEEQREGERATGGKGRRWAGRGSVLFQALREREGVRGYLWCHAGVQNTPRLKLQTKTSVGAKPEIYT